MVRQKEMTVADSKLCQDRTLGAGEGFLGFIYQWRNSVENRIFAERIDAGSDSGRVDGFESLFVVSCRHDAVGEERLDGIYVFGPERVFQAARPRISGGERMRRVIRSKS